LVEPTPSGKQVNINAVVCQKQAAADCGQGQCRPPNITLAIPAIYADFGSHCRSLVTEGALVVAILRSWPSFSRSTDVELASASIGLKLRFGQ
jgi:hypothetical protein